MLKLLSALLLLAQAAGPDPSAPQVLALPVVPAPPVVVTDDEVLPPPTVFISHPNWVRAPVENDFDRYRPWEASNPDAAGEAVLACTVTARGVLRDCSVLFEQPEGLAFGDAALRMSKLFRMASTADGRPVKGLGVLVDVRWPTSLPSNERPLDERVVTVIGKPRWLRQPKPGARAGDVTSGDAILLCKVRQNGGLDACRATGAGPQKAAALALAKDFQVAPVTADGGASAGLSVIVKLRFSRAGVSVLPLP